MIDDEIAKLREEYDRLAAIYYAAQGHYMDRVSASNPKRAACAIALRAFGEQPSGARADEYRAAHAELIVAEAFEAEADRQRKKAASELNKVSRPLNDLESFRRIVHELEGLGHEPKTMMVLPLAEPEAPDGDRAVVHFRHLHRDLQDYGKRVKRYRYKIADLI